MIDRTKRTKHIFLADSPEQTIPVGLQKINQWLVWKAGPFKANGKFDKFPYGNDGTGRTWQKSHQWMDFEVATKKAQHGSYAGIGLVLPAITADGLHLVALDFDDVSLASETHNPRLDEIRQIHKAFAEPYIEESPSGKGLRMFVTSKVPIQQISAPNPLGGKDEIFGQSEGKWVTVTGKVLGGSGIPDVTGAILAFQARIAQRTTKGVTSQRTIKQSSATKQTPKNCQVDEATKALSKGWTGWPEKKLSDGDGRESYMLSYAGHLRSSGHSQAEIEQLCIQANGEHYHDPLDEDIVLDRARRYEGSNGQPPDSVLSPETIEPDLSLEDRTDAGNVSVLARISGDRLRFVPESNLWIVAENSRWIRDPHMKRLHHEQLKVAAKWQRKAKQLKHQAQDPAMSNQDQERLIKTAVGFESWATQCRNKARLDPMRMLAERDARFVVEAERLDSDPWLLGVANGVVDLKTGLLIGDSLDQYVLKRSIVSFDPNAVCPRWDKFIEEITSSPGPIDNQTNKVTFIPRPDLAATLQRVLGYCLCGSTREHKIFIAFGAGANGKNVLLDTIQKIIADYTATLPPELVMSTRVEKNVEAASPMLRMLQGVRFVVCSESKESHTFDTGTVKRLTGGGVLTARGLHEKPIQFEMTHKVMLMTNNRPNLSNLDPAIRGRIVLIPFDMRWNRVSEADPDPTLHDADKDLAETLWVERDGVLRWLITGAVDYQKTGLNLCPEVIESTINYFDKQDPFRRWFRTLTPCDPAKGQTASKLAQAFNRFRREEDEDASACLSAEQLGRRLKQMGVKFKKTASGTQYGLQAPEEHELNQGKLPKSFSETMTQVITGLASEASGVDIAWWEEE